MQSILADFVSSKETTVNTLCNALTQNVDGATASYAKLHYELTDFTHHFNLIGHTPTQVESVVAQLYPTATITLCEDVSGSHYVYREGKHPVIISNMEIKDRNVNLNEIKRFAQNALDGNCNGILLSQHTGISSKPNFHVDVQNHRVLVYLHNVQFSCEKIHMAMDMVDTISAKLSELSVSPDFRESIPKDVLDDINREYQSFIIQKESMLTMAKDMHKKFISQIDDFKFCALDKYLSTRYSLTKKQGFMCDICNLFTVGTLKGLAAHKRGCNRKHGLVIVRPPAPAIVVK